MSLPIFSFLFFFIDPATTEIYTLSLHDALPILGSAAAISGKALLEEMIDPKELGPFLPNASSPASTSATARSRSEEHTSELQSQSNLVCRLLLEKKKKKKSQKNKLSKNNKTAIT